MQLPEFILRFSPHKVIFPFYHVVSNENCPHLKNLYRVPTKKEFEKNIDQLAKTTIPLTLGEAFENAGKKNKFSAKTYSHISFDDGLREVKDNIAPILLSKGIPATFFITPHFTGNKHLFHRHKVSLAIEKIKCLADNDKIKKIGELLDLRYSTIMNLSKAIYAINYHTADVLNEIALILDLDFDDFLLTQKPYLNSEDVITLKNSGFSIGVHSFDHPEFYLLSDEEIEFQVTKSLNTLFKLTGIKSKTFSFPFTDCGIPDDVIEKIIQQHQIKTFGTAGIKKEYIYGHYQRIPMDNENAFLSATSILTKEVISYYLKLLVRKQKVNRSLKNHGSFPY